jgi:hypothetical protein
MRNMRAQSILEFTFAMIVVLFLIYGVVQTAQWTLLTVAEQSRGMDVGSGEISKIRPTSGLRPIDAVWQQKAH